MLTYEEILEDLKDNPKTWLITGVAGFIGSNLLERLLNLNQRVIGLDNFDTGHLHNMHHAIRDSSDFTKKDTSKLFKFIEGNITNLEDCRKACSGVNHVLHHAALGSVPKSIEDPINSNKANIDGFLNILVASRDEQVDRFVYAASSSTYGDHVDLPKVEENIGNPLSPYAVTKAVNEQYASVFARVYGFKSIGLRYFNIFGKRQDPNGAYAAVIPKWISSIINDEEVFINGDGKTTRDFCYIDNVVQINILAAMSNDEKALDQIYNVAVNDQTSLTELYKLIEDKLLEKVKGLKIKEPVYRDFRIGDVKHSRADITKASGLLGYDPRYKLSDGMDEALDWYVENLTK